MRRSVVTLGAAAVGAAAVTGLGMTAAAGGDSQRDDSRAADGHRQAEAPRTIVLGSLGLLIRAPAGNGCGTTEGGELACTAKGFSGHPTAGRLPVSARGRLRIETRAPARRVWIRFARGVEVGGSPLRPVGRVQRAKAVRESKRSWRVRVPGSLGGRGAVMVTVEYTGARYLQTYYARIRPARLDRDGEGNT